jgi:hypothetical protein
MISKLKSDGKYNPQACDQLAELLAEQLDLAGALEWATTGVELMLADAGQRPGGTPASPAEADPGLAGLLRLRYRIRNDLRLPEDEYDRMLSA